MVTVKLLDLVLVVVVRNLLRNQENRKVRFCLNPKNRLNQEKICQKMGIHLILALEKPVQTS